MNNLNDYYHSYLFLRNVNNLRFDYIKNNINYKNKEVLDIGCGLGFLSKNFSIFNYNVTSIDKSVSSIKLATKINFSSNIKYICSDFFTFCTNCNFTYDIILCMEILEHLSDIDKFVYNLMKISNDKTKIFISSLDRNLISYLQVIFFGEYFFKKLKKGTHIYENFNNLKQLNKILVKNKFFIKDIKFINYNPFFDLCKLNSIYNYNYIFQISLC